MVTFNKKYSNGDITVHWKPELCIHSGHCARQLSSVFNPREKPWINMNGEATEEIISTVEGCPSGVLSWSKNDSIK
jgi:putative redox protein